MIKYGIETEKEPACPLIKLASEKAPYHCEHPKEAILVDGDVRFCKKCEKYLETRGASRDS